MLAEIYCRNNSDPGYVPRYETSNALEALLTKIRMIMFTTKGEVLGHPNLGLSLEDQLFELNVNTNQLTNAFNDQLATYVPEAGKFNVELEIHFQPGEVRDACLIDIYIDARKYLGIIAK